MTRKKSPAVKFGRVTLIIPGLTRHCGRLFVALTVAVHLSIAPTTVASKDAVDSVLLTTLQSVGTAGTVKQQAEKDKLTSQKLTHSHELKD